jgi:hypothetical protein
MSSPVFVHNSLAEIHEDKLVNRIVTDIQWGREFFQFHGMPSGLESRQRVPLRGAPGNPKGDIDVLFRAPDLPQQAVAYQIKRVKCAINQLRNETFGKLEQFKKLAQQANLLAQMGFWQIYAYAIVVVDAREQNAKRENAGKMIFEGLSSEMRNKVQSAVSSASQLFDERVGFGVMELVQTMDSPPLTAGAQGLHIRRFSNPAVQSEQLTKWVAGIFAKPAQ